MTRARSATSSGTIGKDYAPDLTKVGDRLPRRDILRSVFFPSESVDPKYSTTVLAMQRQQDAARTRRQRDAHRACVLKTAAEPSR